MARINWLDPETDLPALDEHVARLEHFTDSMADGVIDAGELEKQEHAVVAAMKAVQDRLDDEQHALVTRLLLEVSAYNVMAVLHELAGERVSQAFSRVD
ncbi:MAG: hypothetical protein KC635_09835 [Myxococcales bacterium]|nr:hypothetical protein [Myxococcales bacterium]MCB9733162.1 hypothetical protein [Deltaproteobacteria bacterium]